MVTEVFDLYFFFLLCTASRVTTSRVTLSHVLLISSNRFLQLRGCVTCNTLTLVSDLFLYVYIFPTTVFAWPCNVCNFFSNDGVKPSSSISCTNRKIAAVNDSFATDVIVASNCFDFNRALFNTSCGKRAKRATFNP